MIKAAVAVAAVAAVVAGGASARPSGVQEACARHAPKRAVREATSDDNLGTIVTHSSGLIRLGINDEGNLNWGPRDGFNARESVGGIAPYGLRYVDADPGHILDAGNVGAEYESTAPGCLCEGWGAGAWDIEGNFLSGGSADDAAGYFGLSDVAPIVVSPSNDDRAQNATTAINAGSCLRVEHEYYPSPASRYLYQVDVTLTNICNFGLGQVKYTRKMDWDMEPTAFSETVELNPGNAADLECLHDNGFASAEVTQNPAGLMTGCVSTNTLLGASDHGAYFRFNFRDVTTATPLAAGASKTLTTFYGAAPTRDLALAALSAVGAEAYSFGHSTEAFPFGDNGYTSIFAFAGVGGDVVIPPGNTYTAPCGAAAGGSCAHSSVSTTGKDVFLQFAKTGVFTATCQP